MTSADILRHRVLVTALEPLAQGVRKLTLARADGAALPGFTPGAHVDLHLPNGLVRPYSLINNGSGGAPATYELAIGLDMQSKGGSRYVHSDLKPLDELYVGTPRNHFPLVETKDPIFFIAGGIGITPIWAMVRSLQRRAAAWQMVYAARSRVSAAFVDELSRYPGSVEFHFDDERGCPLDVAAALARAPSNAHVYCCGPTGLMQRVNELCASRGKDRLHFEWFNAPASPLAEGPRSFVLKLARRDIEIPVPADRSILDVLEEHDVIIPSVCKEGICGTCECRIVSGEAEHRDTVLTDAEREANEVLMVCVSRAKGDTLVLDL